MLAGEVEIDGAYFSGISHRVSQPRTDRPHEAQEYTSG